MLGEILWTQDNVVFIGICILMAIKIVKLSKLLRLRGLLLSHLTGANDHLTKDDGAVELLTETKQANTTQQKTKKWSRPK